MKFSINYSPQAAKLVKSGQIEIDYFKTPPWTELITAAKKLRPIAIHFEIRTAGIETMQKKDWDKIDRFLGCTSTAYVNLHLSVRTTELPHIPIDDPPTPAHKDEVIDRMLVDLQLMTTRFGANRIIAENIPYRKNQNFDLRACAEADVISQIVHEAGCGLLLDISHARITSHNMDIDPKTYMESLPTKQLRELHFTGVHNWNGFLQDHLPILEDDWPWLDWVVKKVNNKEWNQPHMLAFEYGGTGEFFGRFSDPTVIVEQVPRLYSICHALEENNIKIN
ncbi:MAG: DUF692 family protein [Chloroflexi bacterium]|nr:DUF692 family protein [Chloroflexota bacterium]